MGADFATKLKFLPWVLGTLIVTSCVHEAGHAWAAFRLGDRSEGIRRRVNPVSLSHVSWLFLVIVPAVMFMIGGFIMGGAKPVRVRMDIGPSRMALVALAGPTGNFIVAALTLALTAGCVHAGWVNASIADGFTADETYVALNFCIGLSVFLGLLNLIPLPPLDGSRIVAAFMPERVRAVYLSLAIPSMILMGVLFLYLVIVHPEKLSFFGEFCRDTLHPWTKHIRDWIA